MIYLREINYSHETLAKSLSIISAILVITLALRFIKSIQRGTEDKYLAPLAKTIVCLLMIAIASDLTKEKHASAPLSEIDNKVSVKGQRVDIDKLDEKYGYENFKSGNESVEMSSDSHTFKFEYDEVFESGKLSDEYGRYRMLDKGDIDYLRSKQAKGEK